MSKNAGTGVYTENDRRGQCRQDEAMLPRDNTDEISGAGCLTRSMVGSRVQQIKTYTFIMNQRMQSTTCSHKARVPWLPSIARSVTSFRRAACRHRGFDTARSSRPDRSCSSRDSSGSTPRRGPWCPGGAHAQTRQVLKNLWALCEEHGWSPEQLVVARIYHAVDASPMEVNRAWDEAFVAVAPPARSFVGVHSLPLDAAVEIEFQLVI